MIAYTLSSDVGLTIAFCRLSTAYFGDLGKPQ
jgi:hypothetical protein